MRKPINLTDIERAMSDVRVFLESKIEEKGNLSLDTALQRFEEGIKLSQVCNRKLKEVEKKVEILVKDESGQTKRKPFKLKDEILEEKEEEIRGKETSKENLLF